MLTTIIAIIMVLCAIKWYFNGGVNSQKGDLKGQIIIITGANTGLGFEAVKFLSNLEPEMIILACRDVKRGTNAKNQILKMNEKAKIDFMQLDLNDLKSVKNFATNFIQKYRKLDILLNNAGIMALPNREETAQGFEKQIGVNHIGHYLLTELLMPKLKQSPQARIINVSSLAHSLAKGGLRTHDLNCKKYYQGWIAYFGSKLANVYYTKMLAKKFKDEGITNIKACSLHPGVVRTELDRYMFDNIPILKSISMLIYPGQWLFTKNAYQGTQTHLHCCLVPFEKLESGKYYADCRVKAETLVEDWEE